MSDTLTKRCTKCRNEFPATVEYFRERKKRDQLAMYTQCLKCEREKARMYRQSPTYKAREKARRQTPAYKAKSNASRRAYLQSPEGQAKKKAYRQLAKTKARERARQQSSEYKMWEKAYRQSLEGQLVLKATSHRRLARKRNLPDTFTAIDWRRALDYFNHRCAVCGRPAGLWHTLSPDHWIPLLSPDCPGTVPNNIVPLCNGVAGCNQSKQDFNAHEWLFSRYSARKVAQIEKRIAAYFASLTAGEVAA